MDLARGAAQSRSGGKIERFSGKGGKMLEFWTFTMIEAYQEARLEEIQRQYSVRLVRPQRRWHVQRRRERLYQRLLRQTGNLLVRAGHGLQARYPRTVGTGCEACQPAVGEGKA
jgi:hypothetical protein